MPSINSEKTGTEENYITEELINNGTQMDMLFMKEAILW
jgi:hypothetical protein